MTINILLLDDDHDFRKLVALRIKSFIKDASFTQCSNLGEVREIFKQSENQFFDLVVLDQHLPDGRGIDLLKDGLFVNMVVLAVSSDESYEMPGETVSAGAAYFIPKEQVRSKLFQPLVQGIIERNKLRRQVQINEINTTVIKLVEAHIGTLRHEINNPLGAVIGAAYLIKNSTSSTEDQREAAKLVETSGQRIKHVLDKICEALEQGDKLALETKGSEQVFHVPGDKKWE